MVKFIILFSFLIIYHESMKIVRKLLAMLMTVVRMIATPLKIVGKMARKMMRSPVKMGLFLVVVAVFAIIVVQWRATEGFRTTFSQAEIINPINNKKDSPKF